MLHLSLALLAAAILVIGTFAVRGLSHIDEILQVVGPDEPAVQQDATPNASKAPDSWPLATRSPALPFYTPPTAAPSGKRS